MVGRGRFVDGGSVVDGGGMVDGGRSGLVGGLVLGVVRLARVGDVGDVAAVAGRVSLVSHGMGAAVREGHGV